MRSSEGLARLGALPFDIVDKIFERVSRCTQICLALCNKRLYAFFKDHKTPYRSMSLALPICSSFSVADYWANHQDTCFHCQFGLADLLGDWVGPNYRLANLYDERFFRIKFLAICVYGKDGSEAEVRLTRRYVDYSRDSISFESTKLWTHYLPNPYNMGDAWYGEAIKVILARRKEEDIAINVWRRGWRKRTYIFREREKFFLDAIDDEMWELWSEGIALMGF